MRAPIFILGAAQTDFAVNAHRAGIGFLELTREALHGALTDASLEPEALETLYAGDFAGELFTGQGQLGGLFSMAEPKLNGRPASRHEAACASGSVAVLAATAELEAGRHDCALVMGIEVQRNVPGDLAAKYLGSAALVPQETNGVKYVWPSMFDAIARARIRQALRPQVRAPGSHREGKSREREEELESANARVGIH